MEVKLKKKIKDRWVKALRSGEYSQGKNVLRDHEDNFCCLGVLCNLHAESHPETAKNAGGKNWQDATTYHGNAALPPPLVWDWAVKKGDPTINLPQFGESLEYHLAGFNDAHRSFKWIASYIERYL